MATPENSTTQNPIRLRLHSSRGNGVDNITGLKVFKNQVPGMVVLDLAGNYYKCSKWKTSKGEPVWAQISNGGQNLQNYSVYVRLYGASNTTARYSITSKNTVTKDPAIISRLEQSAFEKHAIGTYFFQALNSAEVEKIIAEPNYSIGNFLYTDQIDVDDFPSMTMRSLQSLNEKYDYMRVDSNGKSGPGSTPDSLESKENDEMNDGVTRGMLEGNQPLWWSREAAEARWAAVDANGRSGFGATGSGTGAGSGSGSGGGGSGGGSGSNKGNNNTSGGKTKRTQGKPVPKSTTTVILKEDKKFYTGSNDFSLPYMKQIINHFNVAENSRQRIERIHVFEMIPNSFEFSQLSSQWNEVARSGNYPLVDWSNYNLTKVSFRFLVVAKKLEVNKFYSDAAQTKLLKQTSSIVNDGLLVSIDDQLDNIRAMVGAPAPITMYNLNTLISTEYRYPYTNNTRNMQWIIGDASITATRLTADGKAISAAEVSLTLTEYPVIAREIIPLPPLRPDNPPPPPCKPDSGDPKCTPVEPTYGLWVENTYKYLSYVKDAVTYPTGNTSG